MFYATDVLACCYGRVYNDVSQLDPNDTLVQRGLRSCAKVQKLNIPKMLYWVVYTVPYLKCQLATTLKSSFKASTVESCSGFYDEKNIFSRLGR